MEENTNAHYFSEHLGHLGKVVVMDSLTWLVNKLFARVNPCLVTKIWVVSPSADEILTYIVSIIEEIKPHVTKKQIPQ